MKVYWYSINSVTTMVVTLTPEFTAYILDKNFIKVGPAVYQFGDSFLEGPSVVSIGGLASHLPSGPSSGIGPPAIYVSSGTYMVGNYLSSRIDGKPV